jgi:hypothetical protein
VDFMNLIIEALIFIVIAAGISAFTRVLVSRLSQRGFARSNPVTVASSTLISFVVTELWAQLSQRPRYALITIVICALTAVLATVAQSRNRQELAQFRP